MRGSIPGWQILMSLLLRNSTETPYHLREKTTPRNFCGGFTCETDHSAPDVTHCQTPMPILCLDHETKKTMIRSVQKPRKEASRQAVRNRDSKGSEERIRVPRGIVAWTSQEFVFR